MGEAKKLRVSMLGGCSLACDGKTLDGKNVRSKRIWTLFEYLITYRFRSIPQDELIDLLYQEDKERGPSVGALKTLIHRARAALTSLGFADGKDMILKCAEGYRWNHELPMELDTERFESLLREASLCTGDNEKRLELRRSALELYRGDFLPDAAADIWAMSISTYFHFQYMTAVNEVLGALAERGGFHEIVEIAEKAIVIDPYVESLYFNLILALMNTNRRQAAREQYESMKRLFYGEFGIAPSKELQALYKELVKSENGVEKDINVVSSELRREETESGAFFCEYEIFRDVFKKELSDAGRQSRPIHICLINASGRGGEQLPPRKQNTVMRRLCSCIRKNLRGGDMFSRYSVSQFIILLPLASRDDSECAMERITKKYRRENPHSTADVGYTLQTIEPVLAEQTRVLSR
ncbi:MAG: BTAD domain-containing putative transcriptional regulator [Oscillospiraceae bacterium]|nr:BTAD domain-containing putative transcriptional regulator [Oscillospiraceae bacterium]